MAKNISVMEKTWHELIAHVLRHEHIYVNYSTHQSYWLHTKLYTLFTSEEGTPITPESIYRCLVLLDKNTPYGRYALIFNMRIHEAVNKEDYALLTEVCVKAEFPELEALTPESLKIWQDNINSCMLEYNLYTDREMLSTENKNSLEERLKSCYEEICSYKTECNARYINSYPQHMILLSERDDSIKNVWSIREIDVIFLLLSKGNNPFTDKPLSTYTRTMLTTKYKDVMKICKQAHKLGYRHVYKL